VRLVTLAATALSGVLLATAAAAADAAPAKPAYDINKDPCGPVIQRYCSAALAKMDHPAIHACLIAHDDELTNACRTNMAPPRPPLRPEPAQSSVPATPPKAQ
jgi:hypothetical protein